MNDFLIAAESTSANPHRIVVEIARGGLTFWRAVCDATVGASCRLWCEEGCDEAGEEHDGHQLFDQGECGLAVWLNADPGLLPELYAGDLAPLHSGPILIDWERDGSSEAWMWRYDVREAVTA